MPNIITVCVHINSGSSLLIISPEKKLSSTIFVDIYILLRYVCMYVCVHAYMHVIMYVCIHVHVCVYVKREKCII